MAWLRHPGCIISHHSVHTAVQSRLSFRRLRHRCRRLLPPWLPLWPLPSPPSASSSLPAPACRVLVGLILGSARLWRQRALLSGVRCLNCSSRQLHALVDACAQYTGQGCALSEMLHCSEGSCMHTLVIFSAPRVGRKAAGRLHLLLGQLQGFPLSRLRPARGQAPAFACLLSAHCRSYAATLVTCFPCT